MRLLLDTHIFLWYIASDPRLSIETRSVVDDIKNEVYLSVASVWEAVVKNALGKLPFPSPPSEYLPLQRNAHGIFSLPIDEGVMPYLACLPALHRDPFDRVIVAQALQYGLTIVTVDADVRCYPVPVFPPV